MKRYLKLTWLLAAVLLLALAACAAGAQTVTLQAQAQQGMIPVEAGTSAVPGACPRRSRAFPPRATW